ncbi:MAG: type I secretion protein [Rhodobacteraceae bacterium]|nr:type I secretion protein [Paracoccaceae bacterium]
MLVTVPGPVGRIEIDHVQVGPGSSIVTVTDVFFDVPAADTSTEGDDIIDGGTGNDILIGYGGDDTLIGGDGDDDISGGDGSDTVDGGDGDDTIDTSGGGAIPLPDRGFPAYNGLPAVPADADPLDDRDTVDGGDGDDTILTGDDDDIIDGGDGDDTIDGGLDDDTIDGGDGDDTIIGGEGADTIDGGLGDDTIYGGLDPRFPDSLNIPNDGAIVPADPETTNGMDVIDGGAGDDTIFGQDDDDIIDGGTGDDTLDGGIDDDIVDGGDGNDTVLGGQGNDVVDGSDGDDIVDGGDGSDLVIGGAGADQLFGGDENDIIGGGIGDVIEGGEGGVVDFDTLIVSGGIPVVDYTATDPEAGTITFYDLDLNVIGTNEFTEIERAFAINLDGIDPGTPPVIEGRTFTENVVEGTAGDDVIDLAYTGDPEGDRIDNMDARPPLENDEDLVVAGAGDDIVRAGEDSDLIFGNSGDDQLFGEAGNDGVQGGTGDDFISGGAGGDILVGGEGDDTITGDNDIVGDTADLIFGNEGDDTFINNSQGDIITGGEDADGLDIDTLDLRGTAIAANPGGTLTVEYDATDPEAGVVRYFDAAGTETGTVTFSEIEVVIPCFTPGTLIATPKGERRVEDLKVGDRVITRDNGIQAIRWLGKRTLNSSELLRASHLQPVLIRQGALGNGLPERDMMVSPNHRVLVANDKTALYFEEREVLVAAKHLTGLEGVDRVEISSVTYIHFMFEQHEVVLSDGAWTESFQPGDQTLDGLGNAQRNEIFELFPELKTREGLEAYQSARRSLKKHEAHLLTH